VLQTADVSAEHPDAAEAARAAELARIKSEKAKAAAKARKGERSRASAPGPISSPAREGKANGSKASGSKANGSKARTSFFGAQQRTASNQQDQFYYGQRQTSPQPRPAMPTAPRPSYGPFGGFGRGW